MESKREHKLGDEILIVLSFLDEPVKFRCRARYRGLIRRTHMANRPQGVGIRLPDSPLRQELKKNRGHSRPVIKVRAADLYVVMRGATVPGPSLIP